MFTAVKTSLGVWEQRVCEVDRTLEPDIGPLDLPHPRTLSYLPAVKLHLLPVKPNGGKTQRAHGSLNLLCHKLRPRFHTWTSRTVGMIREPPSANEEPLKGNSSL